ncbi:MAG: DUF3151 domain-containing protein [Euzebyales bacterium]|nr:DUF3151 domain-containing protein [Euzebyales bacterium]
MSLPLHGVNETLLDPEPESATSALDQALTLADDPRAAALRAVVADHPAFLDGWARLAETALDADDPVAAYAFARTGYHRGLDKIRRAGWGGQGPVPWRHEPNRGFLRSVNALLRAADAIGEDPERDRCREFLRELDPDNALGV